MKYFCSSLLFFSLIAMGGTAVAQSGEANNSEYPEEFVRQYATECIQTSMGEGLSEAEAQKLCSCTIEKFQNQYELEEFKQLTVDSLQDEKAQGLLVQVGQVCFEEILYEQ